MRIHRGEDQPAFINNDIVEALPIYQSEQGTSASLFGGVALFLLDGLHRIHLSVEEVDKIIAAASMGRHPARRYPPPADSATVDDGLNHQLHGGDGATELT